MSFLLLAHRQVVDQAVLPHDRVHLLRDLVHLRAVQVRAVVRRLDQARVALVVVFQVILRHLPGVLHQAVYRPVVAVVLRAVVLRAVVVQALYQALFHHRVGVVRRRALLHQCPVVQVAPRPVAPPVAQVDPVQACRSRRVVEAVRLVPLLVMELY